MFPKLIPLLKFYRWVRFLDRIQYLAKGLAHKTHTDAARDLIDDKAHKNLYVVIDQSENEYMWVHPDIVDFWKAMHKECKARRIPIRAYEFLRTRERQDELHAKGVSNAKAGRSPHQYGCAVDIISATKAWDLSKKQWDVIGSIGKEIARKRKIKITWGGDFQSLWDPAHWEIRDWEKIRTAYNHCVRFGIKIPEETKLRFAFLENVYEARRNV
jgi:hypothetical protein